MCQRNVSAMLQPVTSWCHGYCLHAQHNTRLAASMLLWSKPLLFPQQASAAPKQQAQADRVRAGARGEGPETPPQDESHPAAPAVRAQPHPVLSCAHVGASLLCEVVATRDMSPSNMVITITSTASCQGGNTARRQHGSKAASQSVSSWRPAAEMADGVRLCACVNTAHDVVASG
jgi:hypothetical protein